MNEPAPANGRLGQASAWASGLRDGHTSVDVGFRVIDRDRRVAAMVLAGGIAYRLFFWALALSLVGGGALGFFDRSGVEKAAEGEGLSAGLAAALSTVASSAAGNEWWLIAVGAWLLLWTGYTSAKALVLTHATVWDVAPPKLKHPLRASLLFTGGTLGLIAAMTGARWLRDHATTWGLVTTLLLFALPFAAWLLCSRILPNRSSSWRELAPGAALVALGFQALNTFTAYFLGPKLTSATQLYGVVGIVTTILFWFYIMGRLIIASATLSASFTERRRHSASE